MMAQLADHNWRILPTFECPVCLFYMHPPIKQCNQGHSLCELCYSKVQRCPTCRHPLSGARNYALENLHVQILFPCRYKEEGCPILCSGAQIKKHETDCVYGGQVCPLLESLNCEWRGNILEILSHCESEHPDHYFKTGTKTLTCEQFLLNENVEYSLYQAVFFAHNNIFKVVWEYEGATKLVRWCVYFIGPTEFMNRFNYEIELENNKAFSSKIILSAPCEPSPKQGAAENYNVILTHFDMLRNYCHREDLIFNVKIMRSFY